MHFSRLLSAMLFSILFSIGLELTGNTAQARPVFDGATNELDVDNGELVEAAAAGPGSYILDCYKLPWSVQEHPHWNSSTVKDASCRMIRKDIYQHFLVKIPNDRIFDQTRILERGEKACGSGVFDRLHGPKCISGFFSCHLQEDGTAVVEFTCALLSLLSTVTQAFQDATCDAFPDVKCRNDRDY